MRRSPGGTDINNDNSLFKRPKVDLLNEEQWLYVQKRYHISPRELQVAKLICQGFDNEEIARDLKISHRTVKTHLRNVYRRVRVRNKITMLLKFVDAAVKFAAGQQITPPIAIIDVAKPRKKPSAPVEVPKKPKDH